MRLWRWSGLEAWGVWVKLWAEASKHPSSLFLLSRECPAAGGEYE